MNNIPESVRVRLRQLAENDSIVMHYLDKLIYRRRSSSETTVARIAAVSKIDYSQALGVARRLAEYGAGEVVLGRHGSSTRLRWNYDMRQVAYAAMRDIRTPMHLDWRSVVDIDYDDLKSIFSRLSKAEKEAISVFGSEGPVVLATSWPGGPPDIIELDHSLSEKLNLRFFERLIARDDRDPHLIEEGFEKFGVSGRTCEAMRDMMLYDL